MTNDVECVFIYLFAICVFSLGRYLSISFAHFSIGWFYLYHVKAMAPHSSTLAWKIPWTQEPGRLQSMGSQRVGHDWAKAILISNLAENLRCQENSGLESKDKALSKTFPWDPLSVLKGKAWRSSESGLLKFPLLGFSCKWTDGI